MDNGNETALEFCQFLNEDYFFELHKTFVEAYSDYVIPFAVTEEQFRNHIILTAVDLERTVGYVKDGRLVGFSLNGFGIWDGKSTVYDAGTGVVPNHRRMGASQSMFNMMLPIFKENGVKQFLLEVIITNAGAINLYKKLGFHPVRELALLQCDGEMNQSPYTPPAIEISDLDEPEWELLTKFWDGKPSWQNSVEAINRSKKMKRCLGAFENGKCVGYIIFSSTFGRVAQIAVHKNHRNRGIGTKLVRAMKAEAADGFSMQVINIDKAVTTATEFFRNRGFYERLCQHEMVRAI